MKAALALLGIFMGLSVAAASQTGASAQDWPRFGWDLARSSASTTPTGIGGTAAWILQGGKLVEQWKNASRGPRQSFGGTSPMLAGGLLYVYAPKGGLRIYQPATGVQLADLACGSGHWNSPIAIDGRIALPEGNANRPVSSGVLDIGTLRPAANN